MRRSATLGIIAVAVTLGVAAPASASADPSCTWSWTDLPLPANAQTATVAASDGHGTYAGSAFIDYSVPDPAVLWQGGTATSLGAAFGADTTVWGVNSNGVVVGQAGGLPVRYRAGQWEHLPVPAGAMGAAMYVNDRGDVAGAIGIGHPILWPATGGYQQLTTPIVTNYSEPRGIAQDGTVAVWVNDAWYHKAAAFLLAPDGTWTRATSSNPDDAIHPAAVNEDILVGTVSAAVDPGQRVVAEWDRSGAVVHTYQGDSAVDVNAAGQILGTDAEGLAIWRDGALEAQLPSTIDGVTVTGVAIDDDGVVVGQRDWTDQQASRPVVARCA
jgi:hypothetical protein